VFPSDFENLEKVVYEKIETHYANDLSKNDCKLDKRIAKVCIFVLKNYCEIMGKN